MARFLALLVVSLVAGCAYSTATPPPSSPASAPPVSAPPARVTSSLSPSADIRLELVADSLVAPVALVSPGGEGAPSFVVDQTGTIRMLHDGQLLDDPWLDLSDRLVRLDTEYDERGLLGLACHPAFAENGRLFASGRGRHRQCRGRSSCRLSPHDRGSALGLRSVILRGTKVYLAGPLDAPNGWGVSGTTRR
jgi:glucose/arabinose dehydrogenase